MDAQTTTRRLHTIEEIRAEARRRCRERGDKLTPARAAHVAAILRPYLRREEPAA